MTFLDKAKQFIALQEVLSDQQAIWVENFGVYLDSEKTQQRTSSQNKALHLYLKRLADAFNDAGLDMRKVLKQDIDINWTTENVKEYLWKPIQETLLKKESTTELNKKSDIDQIYEILNRHIGEKFGIHIAFPTYENEND